MRFQLILPAVAAGLLLATASQADTLSIDRSNAERMDRQNLPTRGMSMRQVENGYGAPLSRRAPIGNPPISRWEYQGYIVFFEYSHVIHAVEKHSKQP